MAGVIPVRSLVMQEGCNRGMHGGGSVVGLGESGLGP